MAAEVFEKRDTCRILSNRRRLGLAMRNARFMGIGGGRGQKGGHAGTGH